MNAIKRMLLLRLPAGVPSIVVLPCRCQQSQLLRVLKYLFLGGFATSADPVKDLPGTSGEAFWEVRQSPGELSQGAPGRGGAELSGGVPGSSPWDLGGGGLGAPGESQGELKMESNGVSNGISKWTRSGP